MEAEAFMRCKKSKKRRKKKRNMEFEAPFPINVDSVREQKQVDTCKSVDTVKLFQIESIDIKDNIVLQKLLQAPRCFDPPESSWRMCHNSEEEAPTAVACSAEKQKKPCFLCGSFKHSGNHCKQARNCFVYERSQHTRSCPEKNQGNCPSSMICLRCGGSGHDMLFCRNEYSSDDLKEIQCYVCKRYGHLCCVDFPDIPRQASCYKCGHYGHLGSDCTKWHGDITNSMWLLYSISWKRWMKISPRFRINWGWVVIHQLLWDLSQGQWRFFYRSMSASNDLNTEITEENTQNTGWVAGEWYKHFQESWSECLGGVNCKICYERPWVFHFAVNK